MTCDSLTYPTDPLSSPDIHLTQTATKPVEIPGVVNGAFRLYTTTPLAVASLSKTFQYECLGNLALCDDGLTFGLWARLHADMWTDTTNFHTLVIVTGTASTSPGFHVYFKGRAARLEMRDITAGKKRISKFDIPIEKWFHLMFTWSTGSYPTVYINSFTVSTVDSISSKTYTAAIPPNTNLYLAYSTMYAAYKTLTDMDDVYYNASARDVTTIKQLYG